MTIREHIKEECIKKDIHNMLGQRTINEIEDYYENQSDKNLILLYINYFGSTDLLDLEIK